MKEQLLFVLLISENKMTPQERADLIADLKDALSSAPVHHLTPEEAQWVRLAIEAQAERAKLRKAIIEKSLGSLVWFGIVGIGYIFLDFLRSHGLRL